MHERVAIVGLGYVGLPVALAFARKFEGTIGFDVSEERVQALRENHDWTGEVTERDLRESTLTLTSDPAVLRGCTFFVVAVPTPLDSERRPDLGPLLAASRTVGSALEPGAVVVYESTVYPGVTEERCGAVLAEASGLLQSRDFKLGYSPERINPGDKLHTFERIVKVVSGEDAETLDRVAAAYEAVVDAGVHRAASIKVAEAAKVIENTQRDVNIALMNELALILDRLDLRTTDVLAAAQTKWNFLPFSPGLVGGHCIGVDPYYLTAKAEAVGYHPEVILAGRRINDGMPAFVVQRLVKMLIQADLPVRQARVGILGMTFKENVPDLRNSKVGDIVAELRDYGTAVKIHDPLAEPADIEATFGVAPSDLEAFCDLDALVLAVPHAAYLQLGSERIFGMVRPGGALLDIKAVLSPHDTPADRHYWSL
jgi:UDP-N-acetyl-D-galactosamine dehydrogenase